MPLDEEQGLALPLFSIRRKFNQMSLIALLAMVLMVWGTLVSYFAYTNLQDFLQASSTAQSRSEGATAAPAELAFIAEMQDTSSRLIQLLVLGAFSALLLVVFVFMYIKVGWRLIALEVWIRRMGAGDLDYKVEMKGKDELVESATSLEELRQRSIKAMQLDLVTKLSNDLQAKNEELEGVLAELRQTQDRIILRQKLAELGELTAGVAHEIRNPLNFMKNFSEASDELLAELQETLAASAEVLDDDKQALIGEICNDLAGNLDRIRSHGDRANRIVRDMLMLGRGGGAVQPVQINDLLKEHAKLAFQSARALDTEFQLDVVEDLDPNAGQVSVVPEELGRVFQNMVGNACYATDEKRRSLVDSSESYRPTLWLQTKKNEHAVEIRIRDNGTGIPPDVMDKVFNPFFTTKPADKGTGLGLSLSNDIVRQHGGAITPDSKPGEYTEMLIAIPFS